MATNAIDMMKSSPPKFEDFVAGWDRLLKAGKNKAVEESARELLWVVLPIGGMAKRHPDFVQFKGAFEGVRAMRAMCRRYIRLSNAQG